MNPLLSKILSENCGCDFVSSSELQEARRLELQYFEMRRQRDRLKGSNPKDDYNAAVASYLSEPTGENLERVERAALRTDLSGLSTYGKIKGVVSIAFLEWISTNIVPFATRLIGRAQAVLSERIAELREIEETRTRELTGAPMKRSEILEALTSVQSELQVQVINLANHQCPPPSHWLSLLGYGLDSEMPSWAAAV